MVCRVPSTKFNVKVQFSVVKINGHEYAEARVGIPHKIVEKLNLAKSEYLAVTSTENSLTYTKIREAN